MLSKNCLDYYYCFWRPKCDLASSSQFFSLHVLNSLKYQSVRQRESFLDMYVFLKPYHEGAITIKFGLRVVVLNGCLWDYWNHKGSSCSKHEYYQQTEWHIQVDRSPSRSFCFRQKWLNLVADKPTKQETDMGDITSLAEMIKLKLAEFMKLNKMLLFFSFVLLKPTKLSVLSVSCTYSLCKLVINHLHCCYQEKQKSHLAAILSIVNMSNDLSHWLS